MDLNFKVTSSLRSQIFLGFFNTSPHYRRSALPRYNSWGLHQGCQSKWLNLVLASQIFNEGPLLFAEDLFTEISFFNGYEEYSPVHEHILEQI